MPKLEAAKTDWQRGMEIIRKLAHCYFEGKYLQYHQAIKGCLPVDLRIGANTRDERSCTCLMPDCRHIDKSMALFIHLYPSWQNPLATRFTHLCRLRYPCFEFAYRRQCRQYMQ